MFSMEETGTAENALSPDTVLGSACDLVGDILDGLESRLIRSRSGRVVVELLLCDTKEVAVLQDSDAGVWRYVERVLGVLSDLLPNVGIQVSDNGLPFSSHEINLMQAHIGLEGIFKVRLLLVHGLDKLRRDIQ